MVTIGDLEAVSNSLRAEIPGIVSAMLTSAKAETDAQFKELNDRAVVEIQTMGLQLTQQQQQQQQVGAQYTAAVNTAVAQKFDEANASFKGEQERISALIEQLRQEIATVESGALEGLPARLLANEQHASGIAQTLHLSVESMRQEFLKWSAESAHRMSALERFANDNSKGVGQNSGGGGGGRGYQLKVPDPGNWKLDKLKDGNSGFHSWRKSLDLQVRAVWAGLDVILEQIRESDEAMNRSRFEKLLWDNGTCPPGHSPMDWDYTHISNKLYSILHLYCDVDPTKIIEEAPSRCGLEAYRLLSKKYDPYSIDTEFALMNHILQISTWSVK